MKPTTYAAGRRALFGILMLTATASITGPVRADTFRVEITSPRGAEFQQFPGQNLYVGSFEPTVVIAPNGYVPLSASVSGETPVVVEYRVDGNPDGCNAYQGPNFDCQLRFGSGTHRLMVTAIDGAGVATHDAESVVVVSTHPYYM